MSNICEIKIKGLDPNRMPSLEGYRPISNAAKYIYVFFELTQKAPISWCSDFNSQNTKKTKMQRLI